MEIRLSKDLVVRELKMLALYLAISVVQAWLMCYNCTGLRSYSIVFLFTFLMWVLLWHGNSKLTDYLSLRISWIRFPVRRFFLGLVTTISYSLIVAILLLSFIESAFSFSFGDTGFTYTLYFAVGFTMLISLFLHSREFLNHWRRTALDAEKYKRAKLAAQYESLKNRVNPQLLFNSLVTLRRLTVQDKDHAVKFIKHLSDVYRYILDTRDKELVQYQQEQRFLTSFVYLLEARHGDSVNITVKHSDQTFYVSPLALQMIIETVIDNSILDSGNPLRIAIEGTHSSIAVEAFHQWKEPVGRGRLTDILHNIQERYRFLADETVNFDFSDGFLKVILPRINMN